MSIPTAFLSSTMNFSNENTTLDFSSITSPTIKVPEVTLLSSLSSPSVSSSLSPTLIPSTVSLTDISTTPIINGTLKEEHCCMLILHKEIGTSRVRIWDVAILIPNTLFLLWLVIRFNRARLRLRATNSPIFSTFYALVVANGVISVVRCVVAMTVNAANAAADRVDKVLWVIVTFFLLSTELSVIIFGLAFGHLDSRTSIRWVLLFTSLLSLVYSISQGLLEVVFPSSTDSAISKSNHGIFGHGGMIFLLTSSIIFCLMYIIIFILPWTRLRERLPLPSRRLFYYYVFFLALLNCIQAVGSGLMLWHLDSGLCIIDVTSYIYFIMFTPLVYKTFLSDFFGITQPSIMFSYKAQVDEVVEEDNVSLPHQLSCSSLKTDSDYIYQNHSLYDSTQFEASTPVNPLYAHSLQSPDSLGGGYNMSRSNSLNSDPGYQQGTARPLPYAHKWE